MNATSFRAYTKVTHTNSWKDRVTGERVTEPVDAEDIALTGPVTNNAVSFDAGDMVITKVVFYEGEGDDEAVIGSVDVNASGYVDVSLAPTE